MGAGLAWLSLAPGHPTSSYRRKPVSSPAPWIPVYVEASGRPIFIPLCGLRKAMVIPAKAGIQGRVCVSSRVRRRSNCTTPTPVSINGISRAAPNTVIPAKSLPQSLNEVLLGRIYLTLHMELLHGVSQLLLRPDSPRLTVTGRVELAVREAMFYRADLAYGQGTPKEQSVRSYLEWLQGFSTSSEALACAVRDGFDIGDELMEGIVRNAYRTLLEATDPAVKYFASTLDVLPRQPREVIPCVEWLGPEKERHGCVKTPAGTALGYIDRGQDGLWYITPLREGAVTVSSQGSEPDGRPLLLGCIA